MNWRVIYTVFKAMFLEEWRLQNAIFSGTEFGYFPLAIAFLGTLTGVAVGAVGIGFSPLLFGTTLLAFALGLQAGSLGFESNDSLDALLGDITPLLHTTRTHPIDPRTAILIFIVKDVLYYAFLFLLPITIGLLTGSIAVGMVLGTTPTLLTLVILTTNAFAMQIVLFTLGTAVALAASSAVAESLGRLIAAALVVLVAITASQQVSVTVPTVTFPFGIPEFFAASLTAAVLAAYGILRFSPAQSSTATQADGTFDFVYNTMQTGSESVLLGRHLSNIRRTTGGIWKTVFSAGLVLTATSLVFIAIQRFLPLEPSLPVLLAIFASVAIVPTYIWGMQVDTPSTYSHEPVSTEQLLRTKLASIAIVHLPVLALYLGLSLLIGGGFGLVALGFGLLSLISVYFLGLTAFLTGFEPGVALFEPVTFSVFSGAGMIFLLPLIIIGLFPSPVLLIVSLVLSVLSALVGFVLMRRSLTRWS